MYLSAVTYQATKVFLTVARRSGCLGGAIVQTRTLGSSANVVSVPFNITLSEKLFRYNSVSIVTH